MKHMHVVYILKCKDGSYYTGYTNNLENRLRMHSSGKASKYTRSRLPVTLVYVEEGDSKSWGLRREYEIKQMTRKEKEHLISEKTLPFVDSIS